MPTVLLTGATGYIGSHTCVEVMAAGWTPVIVDNLCNSSPLVLDRIERITGRRPAFVEADVRDRDALDRIFGDACDRRGRAFRRPQGRRRIGGRAAALLREQRRRHDRAARGDAPARREADRVQLVGDGVRGCARQMPLDRGFAARARSIRTAARKLMVEQILRDVAAADPAWRVMLLRYFNPVGAHESGLIGEDPAGIPNNLMPFVAQVAVGRRPRLCVYGNDYPTADGTGVRDYIHVVDLALGHVAALGEAHGRARRRARSIVNLGTGRGHSVLEVVQSFEAASGRLSPTISSRAGPATWRPAMRIDAGAHAAGLGGAARARRDVRRRLALAVGQSRRVSRVGSSRSSGCDAARRAPAVRSGALAFGSAASGCQRCPGAGVRPPRSRAHSLPLIGARHAATARRRHEQTCSKNIALMPARSGAASLGTLCAVPIEAGWDGAAADRRRHSCRNRVERAGISAGRSGSTRPFVRAQGKPSCGLSWTRRPAQSKTEQLMQHSMVRLFNHWFASNTLLQIVFDALLLFLSVVLAVAFLDRGELLTLEVVVPDALLFALTMVALNTVVGLYQRNPGRTMAQTTARIALSLLLARARGLGHLHVPAACRSMERHAAHGRAAGLRDVSSRFAELPRTAACRRCLRAGRWCWARAPRRSACRAFDRTAGPGGPVSRLLSGEEDRDGASGRRQSRSRRRHGSRRCGATLPGRRDHRGRAGAAWRRAAAARAAGLQAAWGCACWTCRVTTNAPWASCGSIRCTRAG